MDNKLSKKQKELLKEEKIKKQMSQKAYAQRSLDKKMQYLNTVKFSQKFMLYFFAVTTVLLAVTLFFDYDTIWLVACIVMGAVLVATIVWVFIFKFKQKPKIDEEIAKLKSVIFQIQDKENEKLKKMAEMLNRQKDAN